MIKSDRTHCIQCKKTEIRRDFKTLQLILIYHSSFFRYIVIISGCVFFANGIPKDHVSPNKVYP